MKKFYYFLLSGLLLSSCASSEWAFDDTYEKTKNPLAYNFNERNDIIEFVQKEEKRFNVIISYDFQTGTNNVENEYYLNEQFQYYNYQPYLANLNDCYCIYDGTFSRNYNAIGLRDSYKMTYKNKFYGYFYPSYSYNRNCFSFYNSFYTFGTGVRSNIDGGIYGNVNGLAAHNFDYNDMRYWQYVHTKDYNINNDGNSNGNGGGSGGPNTNNNGFEFEKKAPLMSQIGFNHPDFVLSNIDFDYNRTPNVSNGNGSIQNAQTSSDGNSSLASNNYVTHDSQSASNPFAIYNPYPGTGVAGNHNHSNNPNQHNGSYDNQAVSTTSNTSATASSRSTSTSRRTDSNNNYSSNNNCNNNTQGGGNNNHKGNVYSNKVGNTTYSGNSANNGGGGSAPRTSSGNYNSGGGGTGSNYGGSGGGSGRR